MRPDHLPPSPFRLAREAVSLAALPYRYVTASGRDVGVAGGPVMVIPGFLASDLSTAPLRKALTRSGYRVTGWGLGRNLGARADLLDRIVPRLEAFAADGPATLVGWSLGGIFARELAKLRPDLVSKVVTMGSPFSGHVKANNVWRLYELISRHPVDVPPIDVRLWEKPPVPTIALWSRRDGIVAPACARGCAGECDQAIEVDCTHMGFAANPKAIDAVLRAIA